MILFYLSNIQTNILTLRTYDSIIDYIRLHNFDCY
jgi:hypothetical protein